MLLFQALLPPTAARPLSAPTSSMAIVGPWVGWAAWKAASAVGPSAPSASSSAPRWLTFSTPSGDLLRTFAFAFPDPGVRLPRWRLRQFATGICGDAGSAGRRGSQIVVMNA